MFFWPRKQPMFVIYTNPITHHKYLCYVSRYLISNANLIRFLWLDRNRCLGPVLCKHRVSNRGSTPACSFLCAYNIKIFMTPIILVLLDNISKPFLPNTWWHHISLKLGYRSCCVSFGNTVRLNNSCLNDKLSSYLYQW